MANEDAWRPRPSAHTDLDERDRSGDASGDHERAEPLPVGASAAADAARAGDDGAGEVDRLRKELAEAKDRALRAQAELENFKKRMVREKSDALRYGSEGLLRALLPVIDNLQRAIDHGRASREVEPIVEGVDLVMRSFLDALERHGVKPVEARGAAFDPNLHEAIGHVESDEPPNTVVAEHQRGYTLHDRLLRPAMVTVGKGPAGHVNGESHDEQTRH